MQVELTLNDRHPDCTTCTRAAVKIEIRERTWISHTLRCRRQGDNQFSHELGESGKRAYERDRHAADAAETGCSQWLVGGSHAPFCRSERRSGLTQATGHPTNSTSLAGFQFSIVQYCTVQQPFCSRAPKEKGKKELGFSRSKPKELAKRGR